MLKVFHEFDIKSIIEDFLAQHFNFDCISLKDDSTETIKEICHDYGIEALNATNKYIFYSRGTNHSYADDVAITEAYSLEEAVENFKKYYENVSEDNVQLINCHRKGYVKNIMIVGDY